MQFLTGSRVQHGGTIFKLLVFLVILSGVVVAAWIFYLPLLLTSTLTKKTGFDVKVERLMFNPFSAVVEVQGLVVSNPPSFPRRDYVTVRSFEARAPVATLLGRGSDFDYVRLDITRMVFLRNAEGTLNAMLFYDRLFPEEKPLPEDEKKPGAKPQKKPDPKEAPTPPPVPRTKMAFSIRELDLKIDEVAVEDHYGHNPVNRDFKLNVDQHYLNVTDAKQLFTPGMIRAIGPAATTIAALIPGDLGKVLAAAAGNTSPHDPSRKPGDAMKSIVDTLEENRKP